MKGVEKLTKTALWRGRETALHMHCRNEYNRDLLIFRLPLYPCSVCCIYSNVYIQRRELCE